MESLISFAIFIALASLIIFWQVSKARKEEKKEQSVLEHTNKLGMNEPVSLHPVFDVNSCIGIGACREACPEKSVIGLIKGKPQLINASACVGHGECLRVCPMDAISLVIGTEKRGIDIPVVQANFESNVPGIYVAGELGGMGLIKNAIEQGRQTIEGIVNNRPARIESVYDVIIVGAGPAGLSASLAAMKAGLKFLTIEQEDNFGGSILHYPRHKIVMTSPANLPIYGKLNLRETTKECLLELWQKITKQTGLEINRGERLIDVKRNGDPFFHVSTSKSEYQAQKIILAIGRRGTPRKLGVPGENLPKVTYRLLEPENFGRSKCLVVGGGNSAVEAALSLSEQRGTKVELSYRRQSFNRLNPKNFDRINEFSEKGRIRLIMNSNVKEIKEKEVILKVGESEVLPNDFVLVFVGGVLPNDLLTSIGIQVKTMRGDVYEPAN